MVNITLIGCLGADAKIEKIGDKDVVSFNICDNKKVNGVEKSQWYNCTMAKCSDKLLAYLRKGQCVFVSGHPNYRVFDSAKFKCKMVGIDVYVREVNLIGAAKSEDNTEVF